MAIRFLIRIHNDKPQLYIKYVCFLLELVIVIQYLKFGKLEFRKYFHKKFFYTAFFSTFAVTFLNMLFITHQFVINKGAIYTAFLDNLLMSILFIYMFLFHGDVRGKSMYISITKMIATACASISL